MLTALWPLVYRTRSLSPISNVSKVALSTSIHADSTRMWGLPLVSISLASRGPSTRLYGGRASTSVHAQNFSHRQDRFISGGNPIGHKSLPEALGAARSRRDAGVSPRMIITAGARDNRAEGLWLTGLTPSDSLAEPDRSYVTPRSRERRMKLRNKLRASNKTYTYVILRSPSQEGRRRIWASHPEEPRAP